MSPLDDDPWMPWPLETKRRPWDQPNKTPVTVEWRPPHWDNAPFCEHRKLPPGIREKPGDSMVRIILMRSGSTELGLAQPKIRFRQGDRFKMYASCRGPWTTRIQERATEENRWRFTGHSMDHPSTNYQNHHQQQRTTLMAHCKIMRPQHRPWLGPNYDREGTVVSLRSHQLICTRSSSWCNWQVSCNMSIAIYPSVIMAIAIEHPLLYNIT